MRHVALVSMFIIMLAFAIFPAIGCQSSAVLPSPAAPSQPSIPSQQSPSVPPTQPQPSASPTPSPAASQPSPLQINVEVENGKSVIPVGVSYNIKYSTNQSAVLTMYSILPDDTVVTYITKEINVPGSVVYHTVADRPVGERVLTLKAVGIDGQTAVATYKYWVSTTEDKPTPTIPPSVNPQLPPLQVNVEVDGGKSVIPVGVSYNIKYSTNQSAILTMYNTLPDDTVVTYITKEINVPGSVVYHTIAERPIGERILTLKAVGNDGQTAIATYSYWIGSVQGDYEKP